MHFIIHRQTPTTSSSSFSIMLSLSFIVGIIGNVISILVYTSPIPTFRRVIKMKSTKDYKGLPYITTLLSTSLWAFYGFLKIDGILILTVNGAGACFQTIYVILFLSYAPRDIKFKTLKMVAIMNVGFLGAVIATTLLAIHGNVRITFVGFICSALTIAMYAAPLAVMRSVIATKSVKYMPFFLSFFLFLNAGVWSAYAVLVKDFFIGVPNAVGFLLGAVQLVIYFIYKNKAELTKSSPELEEKDGSAHLAKGGVEMQPKLENVDTKTEEKSLKKIGSLPKTLVSRQSSMNKIIRTLSSTPYELDSNWANLIDLEKGVK